MDRRRPAARRLCRHARAGRHLLGCGRVHRQRQVVRHPPSSGHPALHSAPRRLGAALPVSAVRRGVQPVLGALHRYDWRAERGAHCPRTAIRARSQRRLVRARRSSLRRRHELRPAQRDRGRGVRGITRARRRDACGGEPCGADRERPLARVDGVPDRARRAAPSQRARRGARCRVPGRE